jgi:pimeloyl-ACP methyl ester carboxylesterase
MSHPSKGPPQLPFNTSPSYGEPSAAPLPPPPPIDEALAALPRPRKPYKWYYCEPSSNEEMTYPAGAHLHTFLRGYFHLKSADWDDNHPHRLETWTATELEKMPRYYVMDLADTMRQAVARDMEAEDPGTVASRSSRWLPDAELAVYVQEYGRTTFQGGLNWYKVLTQPEIAAEMEAWSGMKIPIPTILICGKSDWGTYQVPGALEAMEQGKSVGPGLYKGTILMDGAGHWVNQEEPERCVEEISRLIKEVSEARTISAGVPV